MKKLFLLIIPFILVSCVRPTNAPVKETKPVGGVVEPKPVENEFIITSISTYTDAERISLYKIGEYECLRTSGYGKGVAMQCFHKPTKEQDNTEQKQ